LGKPTVDWGKVVKDTARYIIHAEQTTVGRVNLLGVFLVGVAGILQGGLFSREGVVLVSAFIISSIIASYFQRRKRR